MHKVHEYAQRLVCNHIASLHLFGAARGVLDQASLCSMQLLVLCAADSLQTAGLALSK